MSLIWKIWINDDLVPSFGTGVGLFDFFLQAWSSKSKDLSGNTCLMFVSNAEISELSPDWRIILSRKEVISMYSK